MNDDSNIRTAYICGIMASKLLAFFIYGYYDESLDAFPQIKVGQLRNLPIRPIDFDNPDDVEKHDKMVGLVDRILELNRKKVDENNPETLRLIETQIAATDRQIDRLVYDLYDLTPEEIELVEQGTTGFLLRNCDP